MKPENECHVCLETETVCNELEIVCIENDIDCQHKTKKQNKNSCQYCLPTNDFFNTMPIKIVDKQTNDLKSKVVRGEGIRTAIAGIPMFTKSNKKSRRRKSDKNNKQQSAKRVWRVLLDSGSDGDLVFVRKGTSEVSYTRRNAAQKWRTSNGTFETNKVGNLNMIFPNFSESKIASLKPDIFEISESAPKPAYDLIIGIQSMFNMGIILNFKTKKITIDEITLDMEPLDALSDQRTLNSTYRAYLEPASTREATNRAVEILDANYKKADLLQVVKEHCSHLNIHQRQKLLTLLRQFEDLFDGTLGEWKTKPVSFRLKPGATPYHGRAFPVPHVHLATLKKEVTRLVKLGVLVRQPCSEWASPTFIVPKKNQTVRFLSDFREVNKRLVRTPFPIPKISTTLQELEGFTFATALDLNMGYYTIRLDGDAQKICTIILPWGKYSYQRLPMGIAGSPDIFQEKMTGLMEQLDYVRAYIDDLLIITKSSYEDHLAKVKQVLLRLREANLRVNVTKSTFVTNEIEYLGYILTREGIKPQRKKIEAILAIKPPNTVRELRRFLGMIIHYRDLWEKRSHLLAPLTDLVGECGQTKATKKKGTKKKPWYWAQEHQDAFDATKAALAREVMLAYPDFSIPFDIYTDASSRQLGAVICQRNRPIAFFSRKLSETQRKYSVTELELLFIVECLKEFKGMLWGQRIKVYTDHKNLQQEALGLTSDRVYRWRLILEEYGPEITYIKGITNTVADALSRLEYDPSQNVKDLSYNERYCYMAILLSHYMSKHGEESTDDMYVNSHLQVAHSVTDEKDHMSIKDLFDQTNSENEEVFPITISEIHDEQKKDSSLKHYFKSDTAKKKHKLNKDYSLRVVDDIDVVMHQNKCLVIPVVFQQKVIDWYHHYLQHPGHTRLEETIRATMYWRSLRSDVRRHVKRCHTCQVSKKRKRLYGKLPTKIAETIPWKAVCVDLIGPYTIKGKDGTILDFMCLTMIDPATGWFEIIELPTACLEVKRDGEQIVEVILDKSSAQVSHLFNKQWLSRYPRVKYIIYDNGSEFKLHFEALCDSYSIVRKPTTVRNPQANAILERIHAVLADMMRTSNMDMSDTVTPQDIDEFLINASWAVRSTYHTVLRSTPGAAIFGRDMLFDIPYIADWKAIGKRRQDSVNQNTARENTRRLDFDYVLGQRVMVRKDGILRKAEDRYVGPYVITQVHTNGTVRIQRGTLSERINIRRITPYFE